MKKRWCVLVICLVVIPIWVVVADQFNRSVEVTDANGTLRAVLFAVNNDNKSGLELKDPNGRVRFAVHTNNAHDPYASFIDVNGKGRIEIGIAPNGDAYLVLRKGNGQAVHTLIAPNQ